MTHSTAVEPLPASTNRPSGATTIVRPPVPTASAHDEPPAASGPIAAASPRRRTERIVVMLATYNERACIGAALDALAGILPALQRVGVDMRVLLVDDESPDGTAAFAVARAAEIGVELQVSSAPRAGLGQACLRGFAAIAAERWADTVVTLDADGQHDPAMIPLLVIERDRVGADLLIGSRWTRGGSVIGLSPSRRLLSRFGNLLFTTVTGIRGVRDATTSFRVFSAELAARFDPGPLSVSGYSFFSSFVGVASASGLRVAEHPIVFGARVGGASKLQPRDAVQFVRNLPALRRQAAQLRARAAERPWVRVTA